MSGCCVVGCTNRYTTKSGLKFYRIPTGSRPFQSNRRRLWLQAIKRTDQNWTEGTIKNARVCSDHFIAGEASLDSQSPDFVPSVFNVKHTKQSQSPKAKMERRADQTPSTSSQLLSCYFPTGEGKDPVLFPMTSQTLCAEQEKPQDHLFKIVEVVIKKEEEEEVPCSMENVAICPIESIKVHPDESAEVCPGVYTQTDNEFMFVCAEKVALEIELEAMKAEMRALKKKQSYYRNKYAASQLTEEVFRMETGLPDRDTFNQIIKHISLSKDPVCYSAGWKVECITVEDQVFLTLMKLKHNYSDLHIAALFHCSVATIKNVTTTFTGILRQLPFKNIMTTVPSCLKSYASNSPSTDSPMLE